MEPIPVKVSDVQIFPYIDAPIQVQPVFVDGEGTYSVGTLTTHIFYNLNLDGGRALHGGVQAGNNYFAVFKGADGKTIRTPWMVCSKGGEAPQFGRTIDSLGGGSVAEAEQAKEPSGDIAYQLHLADVLVSLHHDPREPIEIPLIEGGTGVATFAGLLPGGTWSVSVSGGTRVNPLRVGARVNISGTMQNSGKRFVVPAVLTTRDAGDPASFVQLSPR